MTIKDSRNRIRPVFVIRNEYDRVKASKDEWVKNAEVKQDEIFNFITQTNNVNK